jgi:GNAT superfamily N-acetyltransferase
MDIRRLMPEDFAAWATLLAAAFARPQTEMMALLSWMCEGYPMVAWAAWDGERLAAQYSCLVVTLNVQGTALQVGLSVNMATHPDYRGRGLVKHVAQPVYETLRTQGVVAGVGFSNAAGVKVDRHSKGYGYQVVGRLQPMVALAPWHKSAGLTLTRTFPGVPELSHDKLIHFAATSQSIAHRFGLHPLRRYDFGVWCEGERVCGLVVGLMAAYAEEGCLPELLLRWMNSLGGVRFVHVISSPQSAIRAALKKVATCVSLPYSRTPYYLTAKRLQADSPAALFDLSQWDCVGGDIL